MNKTTAAKNSTEIYVSPCLDVVIVESNCSILVGSGEDYGESGAAGNSGEETDYGTL